MAEYDKGRYYWIKLTDRFMTSDTVDFLMGQKDGANYVVLYQMLCLKTVNNGGIMARRLGDVMIPYDVEKIQRDCKWFSVDTVRIALELYKRLGLIYEIADGVLAISGFDRLVGSQSYGAEKKELQKQRREQDGKLPYGRGGQKVEKFPPERDKYKDNREQITDNRNKDKYLKRESTEREGLSALPIPTPEEVFSFAKETGREDLADKFYKYYSAGEWRDSSGLPVLNWKQKFLAWCNSERDNEPGKVRYGNFDITEAWENALRRTYEEDNI